MNKSRKKVIITCLDCEKVINGGSHMSRHVKEAHQYSSYDEYKLKHNLIKSKSCLESEGAVSCGLCGLLSHDLTSHILRTHKIPIPDYKKDYGEIRSQKYLKAQSERIVGENNPGFNHQGKLSPFSDNFIYADSINKEEVQLKAKNSIINSVNRPNTIKYWINLGYSEEESKNKVSDTQSTFSLSICIQKYGEEEGRERWLRRQEKWQDSCKKTRKNKFSKISQSLFWKIYNLLTEDKDCIYFAELGENKELDVSGLNNEYRLKLPERVLMPDFINIKTKKIIEFDGTYWHGEYMIKNPNKLRDEIRDEVLLKNGYKVLHIKEVDYRNNEDLMVKKCLGFLND